MTKIKVMLYLVVCTIVICACEKEEPVIMQEITEIVTEEQNTEMEKEAEPKEADTNVYVYLCGAVQQPGVYEVKSGTRLFEVIDLSGGLTSEAACDYVNQAREISDGEQIRIPTREEAKEMQTKSQEQEKTDTKIDINTASKELLCTIPGVGKSKAEAIITYREEKGNFQSIEDIKKVTGIKDGMYGKMEAYITVSK